MQGTRQNLEQASIVNLLLTGLVGPHPHNSTITELEMAIKDFEDVLENEHDRRTVASRWTAFKDLSISRNLKIFVYCPSKM